MRGAHRHIKPYPVTMAGLLLLSLLVWEACSVDGLDSNSQSLSADDITAIGQIMGESLSDENSGMVSGLNDAIADISSQGFEVGSSSQFFKSSTSSQAKETNFNYTFDETTGIHTISFTRITDIPSFTLQVDDTLKYFYTTNEGRIVEDPEQQRNKIENVDFTGSRQGRIETLRRTSIFTRQDTFLITGMSSASDILQINGRHTGKGSFETITENGVILARNYEVEINLLNIEIQKNVIAQNQSLAQGVNGTLTWEISITNRQNATTSPRIIRGNIELFGDGTAILRFNQFQGLFQINVEDGDVKNAEEEFEGRVLSVDIGNNSFTLVNGRVVQLSNETEINDSGDVVSLNQVQGLVASGRFIIAEGEGTLQNGIFNATEVEFKFERRSRDNNDDDDSDDTEESRIIKFDSPVRAVNVANNIVQLRNTLRVLITDSTDVDDDELSTLSEVLEAIQNGNTVIAEGEGRALGSGPADVEATEIEFEIEERED